MCVLLDTMANLQPDTGRYHLKQLTHIDTSTTWVLSERAHTNIM